MPSTNGTIESSNQIAVPTLDDCSNAHRQYATMVTVDDTARTYVKNACEYMSSERRVPAPSLSSVSSAYRLPVTMNSDAEPATIRNHGEMETPTATPPAIVRSTNPAATHARSSTASFFNHR